MSPILGVLLIAAVALMSPCVQSTQMCTKDAECPKDLCCLLGPIRYATPHCMPYQQPGQQCRVNAETITTNLTYPDNSRLEVKDVNFILCPCAEGSSCNPRTGICD
ncbi:PREDICTED: astakine-like [Dinoponera quadriceps]|uniref:Astakine-like n=1 Tax=Dinoponera quadriceps TaxID=609295 RepID=A0A6P3Y9Z2_DINQU|nr:PREDICTED: astakine-like [Dinoponera quadriceps]